MKAQAYLAYGVYFIPIIFYTWLLIGPFGNQIDGPRRRGVAFLALVIVVTGLLVYLRNIHWFPASLMVLVGYAAFYKATTFISDLSTYPFSLSWSEASRYYYASLFFSERLYHLHIPPSVLHPTRYLLQAIPFLIPDLPLWFHRFWQVLLWIGFSLGTGFVLARRLKQGWVLALWAFLFLLQGPVYYHLLVMVILILWGVKPSRFWLSLAVILVASAWAGISRVNWFPVPAVLAAALYLLEVPVEKKSIWRYSLSPALWILLGTGMAFLTQRGYILWSGNPADQFGSGFTSDLLWYRLYPSPTYPGGILRNLVWVMVPLLLIIIVRMWTWRRQIHWLRHLGVWVGLIALFTIGLIVSVKIGGGSNLHNMDAFLVMLMVVGSYLYFEKFGKEIEDIPGKPRPLIPLVYFAVCVPIFFAITSGGQPRVYDFATAQKYLTSLEEHLQPVVKRNGEILFIDQRHLLTFGYLKDIPLVPDYEEVFLMEMVMSGNRFYLDKLVSDLKNQRFASIVSGIQPVIHQGRAYAFGEENDAWVKEVAEPLLCYYQKEIEYEDISLVIYVPRETPCK